MTATKPSTTASRPRIDAADIELLRAFEPVVKYTSGESFLPMDVGIYLESAVRMRSDGRGRHVVLGAKGEVSKLSLIDNATDGAATRDFLTVAGAGEEDDVATLFQRESKQAVGFHSHGGRLARVGYASRLIDAMFAISLLARGRVPGSLARRAVLHYRSLPAEHRSIHPYYARVVRTATWTALQYWFFYAFNDWRSGFHGANDHEADWEQIFVYLDTDADGRAVPVWAAYAQHDYHGRDLRRRWDDGEQLDLEGDHPVVYAGAGSHASYFRPGEYLAEQPVALPALIQRAVSGISRLIRGKGGGGESGVSIAFVDFARGDGESIGPGAERSWTPVIMDESQPWVPGYSGLWGMSVEDPFQGEDAPAGPMFNRNRSVRMSWSDPISFAELDLEPPPSQAAALLREREQAVERRQGEVAASIPALERDLAASGAEDGASSGDPNRTPSRIADRERLRTELTALQREREENELRLTDLRWRRDAAEEGRTTPPQAHLRRIPVPSAPGADRTGRALEAWAAVSVGLMLLILVGVLLLAPRFGLGIAVGVIGLFLLIESILRGGVMGLLATWVRLLAVVAAVVVFVNYWELGVIVAAIAAGLFILRENVGELLDTAPDG
jgi:uncharacterized membrane protein